MPTRLISLRWQKLFYCLIRPWCWHALRHGVAPSIEQATILRHLDFDLLLDVGANKGQFTLIASHLYPNLQVHAYEPYSCEANLFRLILLPSKNISLHLVALGSFTGESEFHISNSADSSSILRIGALQKRLFPSTSEASTCRVPVAPLDSFPDHWNSASRALLKIDVQGYELEVLRGAVRALKHCAYVYVECSEIPLYEGQALRPTVQRFLEQHGFARRSRHNETYDPQGTLIQADYLFERAVL